MKWSPISGMVSLFSEGSPISEMGSPISEQSIRLVFPWFIKVPDFTASLLVLSWLVPICLRFE